jgi:regulatory protein
MALVLVALKVLGNGRFMARLSDGREIRISDAAIADYSLFTGMELTEDEAEGLEAAGRQLRCRERALHIVGMRPLSRKEMYSKLTAKGEDPETAKECIDWLTERRYLDDEAYAAMIVRRSASKGYGAVRVKNELYRRGIPRALWEEALEYMPDTDDAVYVRLCSKLGDDPDRAQIKKATDALARRGYSWDEIRAALNRFREEH